MFHHLFNLFWRSNQDSLKKDEEKKHGIQGSYGYVYTDHKAKMKEDAERRKKTPPSS